MSSLKELTLVLRSHAWDKVNLDPSTSVLCASQLPYSQQLRLRNWMPFPCIETEVDKAHETIFTGPIRKVVWTFDRNCTQNLMTRAEPVLRKRGLESIDMIRQATGYVTTLNSLRIFRVNALLDETPSFDSRKHKDRGDCTLFEVLGQTLNDMETGLIQQGVDVAYTCSFDPQHPYYHEVEYKAGEIRADVRGRG